MILVKKFAGRPYVREDPIKIVTDFISVEDILSPADAISNKIKSDAMKEAISNKIKLDAMFHASNDVQGIIFKMHQHRQNVCHKRADKLKDLYPQDPSKVPHRYKLHSKNYSRSKVT